MLMDVFRDDLHIWQDRNISYLKCYLDVSRCLKDF